LTLDECHLWVELTEAQLLEVVIGHGEGSVCLGWLLSLAESVSFLHVDLIDEFWLGTLLGSDLESEGGLYFGYGILTLSSVEVFCHHVEDSLRFVSG